MKILHIINNLGIGGAERLIVEIFPKLIKKGLDVDLLVFNKVNSSFESDVIKLKTNLYFINVSCIYNPLIIFKIQPYLKSYDIVHVHLFPAQYWVAFAKLILKSPPVFVTTEHSTSNRRRENFAFKYLDKYVYSQYKAIICISEGVRLALTSHLGVNSNNVYVVNNGVNIDRYATASACLRREFGFSDGDILLAMVAGFRHQKDQKTLIKSLKLLTPDYKLLLIGDGHNRASCEKLSKDLQVSDRVFFLGIRSDVAEIMKMVDLSVISSFWEGFGLVAVEGMASGKPVLASDVSGLREVVNDPDLLFPVGGYEILASKIINLISDKELYQVKSLSCQKNAEKYSLDKMVTSYIKLYKEILK